MKKLTLAEEFDAVISVVTFDDTDIAGMIDAVLKAGGGLWGSSDNCYIVEFDDGSYWLAAVHYPDNRDPYFNRGPGRGPKE